MYCLRLQGLELRASVLTLHCELPRIFIRWNEWMLGQSKLLVTLRWSTRCCTGALCYQLRLKARLLSSNIWYARKENGEWQRAIAAQSTVSCKRIRPFAEVLLFDLREFM